MRLKPARFGRKHQHWTGSRFSWGHDFDFAIGFPKTTYDKRFAARTPSPSVTLSQVTYHASNCVLFLNSRIVNRHWINDLRVRAYSNSESSTS